MVEFNKAKIRTLLLDILRLCKFKDRLAYINTNYPNLKQENFIENAVLELLNDNFVKNEFNLRAFAEHPRVDRGRADLSIIKRLTKEDDLPNQFLVEFKFQYTKDYNQFQNFERVIERDFCQKKSDVFILIICTWDKEQKKIFDKEWNIKPGLSHFLSNNEKWKDYVTEVFSKYINDNPNELLKLETFSIDILDKYKTTYDFFILIREDKLNMLQERSEQYEEGKMKTYSLEELDIEMKKKYDF